MIGLPSLAQLDRSSGATRIWLATAPADMRCGFDRLAEQARRVTSQDPMSGHLFLFRSRGGDRLKVLYWDRDGYALWYKRLEQGVFKLPRVVGEATSVELRASELAMLLDGIDLRSVRRLRRYPQEKMITGGTAGRLARMESVVMEDARRPIPLTSLPDDPAALKALIATLAQRCDSLELRALRLEVELLKYKKWMYGPRADTLATLGQVNQMLLGFGQDLEARPVEDLKAAGGKGPQDTLPRRVRRGRRNLANFEHLPVTRCEHDLPAAERPCPCCGTMRERIGSDTAWQVEYIPGHFERIEHVRFKYACNNCERSASPAGPQITRADKPSGAIDKGMAGPGLLAFVVTSKFSDYLPLYRLEGIFERNGFEVSRATQSLWCRDVADLVRPLHELMVRRVLESGVVGTDDTVMPMLRPGEGKAKQARMWVYVGDQGHPYNVFQFTLGRSRDGPAQFLKGYKGTLVADAYGGYDGIVVGNGLVRAGCWAHARRKFVDAEPSHPAIAAEAVGIVKGLYAIEERGKALDVASRGTLRRAESAPILAALREKLLAWRDQLLPKHPMAQAVAYTLNQWNELTVFAGDGAVPIDNNASEREMKRIVLNRKNSLFVGNERGGRTAAVLSGLTSTCRRHAIDPQRYLTQLLTNLPVTPVSQLDQWLPDKWKLRDTPPPA